MVNIPPARILTSVKSLLFTSALPPAFISILGAGTIGLLDESIQVFIPYRVFDIVDIGFNYLASAFGVFTGIGVSWLKRSLTSWFYFKKLR